MQLASLGWRPFFADQLAANEATAALRVMGINRSGHVLSDGVRDVRIRLGRLWYRQAPENRPAVGDWVLTDQHRSKIERFLKRQNVLRRMASGAKADVQLIGANIDTLVIVSSCNAEFSMARLQRYLTVAADAEIEPLIVLTKADLATSAESYGQRAREAGGGVAVEVVNALDAAMLGGISRPIAAGMYGRAAWLVRRWQDDVAEYAGRCRIRRDPRHPRIGRQGQTHHHAATAAPTARREPGAGRPRRARIRRGRRCWRSGASHETTPNERSERGGCPTDRWRTLGRLH